MEAEQHVKSTNIFDVLEDDSSAGIPVVPEKPAPVRAEHRANAHTRGAHPQGFHGKGHRAPKREFERHSAPGHERTTHKGGAGRHNWGSEQDDINQVNKAIAEVGLDAVAAGAIPVQDAEEQPSATEQQQQPAQEEPDNTKTFEQFQAELKKAMVADEVKERGVNVDDKAFKKSEPLTRREDDVAFADQIKVKQQKKKEKATKRAVHLDEFRATLPASAGNDDEFRRDGERGGRGRGRGGRGRGGRGRGGRGGRGGFGGQYFEHAEAAPAVDAFASAAAFGGADGADGAVAQDPAAAQDAAAPADTQGFRGGRGRGRGGRGRGGRGRGGPRGGFRGGARGGSRGGRGRGGRGGYSRDHGDAGLNISDESAFPSLSK